MAAGPSPRDPSLGFRIVSRLTKDKRRDGGVNANEFTVLESRQEKFTNGEL